MTYDPAEIDLLDRIRGMVDDTTAPEIFADDIYDSVIDQYTNWKRAAAEMARRVARRIENRPDSMASDGDSMGWKTRTKALYALRDELLAEADAEDAETSAPTAVPYMPVLVPVEWR